MQGSYDTEEVQQFQQVVDRMNLERIKSGLSTTRQELLDLPEAQRQITKVSLTASMAIFEALSCLRFLQDPNMLKHFEEPFRLIQTNKRLRLQCYVPAMISFLFAEESQRLYYEWAYTTFVRFKQPLTASDFDWCIKEPLRRAMARVDITNIDKGFLMTFWGAARLIVQRLDKSLITDCLRAMEQSLYRLMLEHFQLDDESFIDMLGTLHNLVLKSADDFWDEMGSIAPKTIIEQIFASPYMERILRTAGKEGEPENQEDPLDAVLSWIDPFMASIKAVNQPPACRALLDQLLGRIQEKSRPYHASVRDRCRTQGLRILEHTLRSLHDGNTVKTPVSEAVVCEMLDMAEKQVADIAADVRSLKASTERSAEAKVGIQVLQHAAALICRVLHVDFELIKAGQSIQRHDLSKVKAFWQGVLPHASRREVIINVLHGCRELTGIEPLVASGKESLSADQKAFNERFAKTCEPIEELLDRLSGLAEKDLLALLTDPGDASAVFAGLFTSSEEVHKAALEVIKAAAGETQRREALKFVVDKHYANTLSMCSNYLRRIAHSKIYSPTWRILRLCGDVIDVLCDPQDGILRTKHLSIGECRTTEDFWRANWQLLSVIFEQTERWSMAGHDRNAMKDFCRDAMQYADRLFDEYAIFTSSIKATTSQASKGSGNKDSSHLLQTPKQTMSGITKWLRLRDEYLIAKSVSLTCKILVRLKEENIELPEQVLGYIEDVIDGTTRHVISKQKIAELRRALETHTGISMADPEDVEAEKQQRFLKAAAKAGQQGKLDFNKWKATAAGREASPATSSAADTDTELSKIIKKSTSSLASDSLERMRKQAKMQKEAEMRRAQEAQRRKDAAFASSREAMLKSRKEAKEAADKAKQAEIAKARAIRGDGAGSGVQGIGILGKDHKAPKGEGMYVSDESSDDEDSDDDMARELFGVAKKPSKPVKMTLEPAKPKLPQGPVKKKKVVRSAADMRARLQPNLTWLHETVLGWDYFHDGDFPPNARPEDYTKAPDVFSSPIHYQQVFKPLLTLEAWQQFLKAREEGNMKPYDIKVQNRSTVDSFVEVATSMTHNDNKDIQIMDGDIVLLSKDRTPTAMPEAAHCMARVHKTSRKKQHIEVVYRVSPGNELLSALAPGTSIFGVKVTSIIPLEREYAALHALQYYDLCDEIVSAKPSPLLNYNDKQLDPIINTYTVNKAQAKAVKSAIDNDAFTLIQGPPGSGKTKTIVAIVGALLTSTLAEEKARPIQIPKPGIANMPQAPVAPPKKLMVCAPSNAAVDELVMRFKEGVRTLSGAHKKINVVRIGRSDAINTQVTDVTLDELVNARLNINPEKNGDDKAKSQAIFQEHKAVSEKLNEVRDQIDGGTVKGDAASKLQNEFNNLRRRKQQLGSQIDDIKDQEKSKGRQAELNRIKVQQSILDESHIICATLSGSGHDMFRNLNVEFETVVVDEAAQCVEVSSIIPLKYGCSKCILVGDPKQLPPTVFSKEAVKFAYERSLFVRMQSNHPDSVHLLDTQYRMHPEISEFPSKAFYDSRLLDGPDMAALRKRPWHANPQLSPYRFFDVQGQHQAAPKGHSLINLAEIEFATQLYDRLMADYSAYDFNGKIGIITPYKSQLRELKDRFSRKYGQSIFDVVEFNTTDAFQGRESEVIIFSCVRANPAGGIGFLQDIRRMNVGLTRAKSSLWVLGNSESLQRGNYWRQLIDSSKERKRYTTGNVSQLLKQSSSGPWKPQPGETYSEPKQKRPQLKPEPVRRSSEDVRMEVDPPKEKSTPTMVSRVPVKRKASSSGESDVEMKDVPDIDSTGSKATTVVGSAKPSKTIDEVKTANGNPSVKTHTAKPAGAPRPKAKVDPFMPKPKRPKP